MIVFPRHALEKFEILKRHKVIVTEKQVCEAVERPEITDDSRLPLRIVQVGFDKRRVLRVVYKEAGHKKIITFYPGKRTQYEKKK